MKFLIAILLLALAGCESRTDYGTCVGLGDKQNPKLEYKVSARNLVVGIIFFEMIVPPVIVAVNETYCPIGPAEIEPVK
jgi:hypothetical protein